MTDEANPWDEDFAALAPDARMQVLHQLQQYQHAIRRIFPFLDPYETSVLIQLIDRITGWKKHEQRVSAQGLYAGDRMYGGLSRTMDRSRLMKALRSLEDRGVISRRGTKKETGARIYKVHFDVDLASLERSARPVSKSVERGRRPRNAVSAEDQPVREVDWLVSTGAEGVSPEDTLKEYRENSIGEENQENRRHSAPTAPSAATVGPRKEAGARSARKAQAPSGPRSEVNPPPRARKPST